MDRGIIPKLTLRVSLWMCTGMAEYGLEHELLFSHYKDKYDILFYINVILDLF